MSGIQNDLWGWFTLQLDASGDDVASVNPDRLLEFLKSQGLRITFDTKPAPEDDAFDGQYEEPKRALTARERDILCRIIGDVGYEMLVWPPRHAARSEVAQGFGRTMPDEWPMLAAIRDAIDPRGGD
jgi:hypothetical protein